METRDSYTRRRLLKGAAAAATVAPAASATAGVAAAQDDAYDGFLADDDTFDGMTRDGRGRETVQVDVGAQGNQGPNAYDPSAVLVDPGTTIEWVWTGDGFHDVTDDDGEYQTDITDEEGFTFERTFSEEGVHKYYCSPHLGVGMKGVIVVGEDSVETELVDLDFVAGEGLNTAAIWAGAGIIGAVAVAGVAAYRELVDGGTDAGYE